MSFWTVYWITMTLLVAGADIIPATNKTKQDTLSEHIWLLMSYRVFRTALVFLLAWVCVHLLTKGWV